MCQDLMRHPETVQCFTLRNCSRPKRACTIRPCDCSGKRPATNNSNCLASSPCRRFHRGPNRELATTKTAVATRRSRLHNPPPFSQTVIRFSCPWIACTKTRTIRAPSFPNRRSTKLPTTSVSAASSSRLSFILPTRLADTASTLAPNHIAPPGGSGSLRWLPTDPNRPCQARPGA
jgi:hypothetical protein